MKKKLLFVTQYLHTGGIEKSLLTLLSHLDYRQYEVDLLLFDHSGMLYKMIPPQVNILPPLFETFSTSFFRAAPELIKSGKYNILIGKLLAAGLSKFTPGIGTGIRWEVYRRILPRQPKYYDVAISYIDFFCNYYITEKVNADRKIVYNHMDYTYSKKNGWPCPRLERKSFSSSDYIVTVAESSKKSLEQHFPEYSHKMRVIQNWVASNTVRSMAREEEINGVIRKIQKIKIVTVARLVDEKGVFFALEACKILVDHGIDLKWFLIGKGPLYRELEKRISEFSIEDHFILLGEKDNPYPYMKLCDIYVQPSKTEAHCVAVEEAMALCRPIVVTNIPAFQGQVQHMENGLIVESNPSGIAEGIKGLIESRKLRGRLTMNLKRTSGRHGEQLSKFYRLIEG
ncbi:glycosyltransferase [Neobacillus muris]|uniref:glycosyltransferase n=1 Tax=Neobacillus muris TaxID=2941334 RepID=UPI00203AF1B1|nr:glycosyltransferase [Neobacillus muris]